MLLFNLNPERNPHGWVQVLSGELAPEALATAKAKQLASEEKERQREQWLE